MRWTMLFTRQILTPRENKQAATASTAQQNVLKYLMKFFTSWQTECN